MKRLLSFAFSILVAASVSAASQDRDVVLSPDGTVYSIESVFTRDTDVSSPAVKILRLTAQSGDSVESTYVPATLKGGMNFEPSLAYDDASGTLFVFWQKRPNPTSSELLLSSYRDGQWSEATSISAAILNIRYNLRVVTSSFVDPARDNAPHQLVVHVAWWEQTGYGEEAHYALLTMNGGKVVGIEQRRLLDYVTNHGAPPATLDPAFDRSFFRNISMVENSTHDGVEILFADWDYNRLHHVGITPLRDNGVIRVPGGVSRGEIPAPRTPLISDSAKISSIADPSRERAAFYAVNDNTVQYLLLKDGQWGIPRTINRNDTVTLDVALDAIRRLMASE
jgi:hypothetical protein